MKTKSFKASRSERANYLVTNLVKANRDNFDIELAQEIQALTEKVKRHRGVGTLLARKTVIDLVRLV